MTFFDAVSDILHEGTGQMHDLVADCIQMIADLGVRRDRFSISSMRSAASMILPKSEPSGTMPPSTPQRQTQKLQ